MIELKIANEKDAEEWDKLVENSPHGTIFHTWKWLKIMEKHSTKMIFGKRCKSKLYPVIILDGNTSIALFPLFYYKNILKIVSSPPSAVEDYYLGPLSIFDHNMKQSKKEHRLITVIKEIDKYIDSELHSNFTLFHSAPGLVDSRPFKWAGYEVEPRHTYVLRLNSIENIWNNFSQSLRREIKKAKEENIVVSEGSKEELIHIYNLLKERNRIHAPKEFILDIFNHFYSDNLRIFIAEKNDELLSGIVTTCFNEKVSFWIGAPKFSINGINPNGMIFYESMKWALENGYKYYEIIGADDPPLYPFKSKFNGELVNYLTARKYHPSAIKVVEAIYRTFKPRYRI